MKAGPIKRPLIDRVQDNKQISSVRGKIKILLAAVTDMDGAEQFALIGALLDSLKPHTGLLVWCNSRVCRQKLNIWLGANGWSAQPCYGIEDTLPADFRCILLAPAGEHTRLQYSHWARDPFVWTTGTAGQLVLLDSAEAKTEDRRWGQCQWQHLKLEGYLPVLRQAETLPVAGGNLLFDLDFLMIQASTTRLSGGEAAGRVLRALNGNGSRQPLRRAIEIGEGQEPLRLGHLDLYLSLSGVQEGGRYVVLVGRCVLLPAVAVQPALERQLEQINAYLDRVAVYLSGMGFRVKRNPIPVWQGRQAADAEFYVYNNCLLEVVAGATPVVYLPQLSFGQRPGPGADVLGQLENDNIALWQALGFEVRLIRAPFRKALASMGALHCLSNEILRH